MNTSIRGIDDFAGRRQRPHRSVILIILSFVVVGGCDAPGNVAPTPSDVVKTYFTALKKGDQQTLAEIKLDGEGVSPIAVGAARTLSADRGKIACSQTIKGDIAFVTATYENGEIINAVLKNVDGKWKIDVMANEKLIPASSLFRGHAKAEDESDEKKNESDEKQE